MLTPILAYWQWRARPRLRGKILVAGLESAVTLARDRDGVPTLAAGDRADAAFGLGFLHAQERFFQMDLHRRAAAGELAELLGPSALGSDRQARIHQFRRRARKILAALDADEKPLLDSYCRGVNEGLRRLRARPFEYSLLKTHPEAWRAEDTILVVFDMYRTLQDERGDQELHRHLLYDALPREMADVLAPEGAPGDAPLLGPPPPPSAFPPSEIIDLRGLSIARIPDLELQHGSAAGSNVWAVSGEHRPDGKAILANDVHLAFGMPASFYRVTMQIPGRTLFGLTLPGFPFMLAGTNGDVAWGVANAAIHAVDLIALDQDGLPPHLYRTPQGVAELSVETEVVRVRNGDSEEVRVVKSAWGPVLRRTRQGTRFTQRWVAHGMGAVNLAWRRIESSTNVGEAMDAANRVGAPALAVVVADALGDIGWTIAGPIPRPLGTRRGLVPRSSEMECGACDPIAPHEHPRLRSPAFTRLWAANARSITTEPWGSLLGGGYHVSGARAAQIGQSLAALEQADESAMLRIQLDHHAAFLLPWRDLLLAILRSEALSGDARGQVLMAAVERWGGKAAAESSVYRSVRTFRECVERLTFEPFVALVRAAHGTFDLARVTDHLEGPLRQLLRERPGHLLAPWFTDWDSLLAVAAVETLAQIEAAGGLSRFRWGAANRLEMRHPLSALRHRIGRQLDAPAAALDGDLHMPLAQTGRNGPVFRFAVSPGAEPSGYMQMAGGQAGNPAAPYYLSGHRRWLAGQRSSLAPGPTRYHLKLIPERRSGSD